MSLVSNFQLHQICAAWTRFIQLAIFEVFEDKGFWDCPNFIFTPWGKIIVMDKKSMKIEKSVSKLLTGNLSIYN